MARGGQAASGDVAGVWQHREWVADGQVVGDAEVAVVRGSNGWRAVLPMGREVAGGDGAKVGARGLRARSKWCRRRASGGQGG